MYTDWTPVGPRFSNAVLQTLMVLMAKHPPKVSDQLTPNTLGFTRLTHMVYAGTPPPCHRYIFASPDADRCRTLLI
jgi:hypothetical protein